MRKLPIAMVGWLMSLAAATTAGGLIGGSVDVVVVGVLAVVAVPVVGFTWNQMTLTSKGREIARTVGEVKALKQSDAAAFTQPLATVLDRTTSSLPSPGRPSQSPLHVAGRPVPISHGDGPAILPADVIPPMDVGDVTDRTSDRSEPLLPLSGRRQAPVNPVRPDGRHLAPGSFWSSLTTVEQRAIRATARLMTFPSGTVLCREGHPADSLFVIRSGWAKVSVVTAGRERVVAVRRPGDLVGERAVLQVRSRSAAVVALDTVEALVLPAADFAALLVQHSGIVAALERQLYDRLVEDPGARIGRVQEPGRWNGQICSILLTDIATFGARCRDDADRQVLREVMYAELRAAFGESDVRWAECHCEDRGDGALIIVPPGVPTRYLVYPMLSRLAAGLRRHNHRASEAVRLQLRVSLHVGPVDSDADGVSGGAIIHTARLLESPPLKAALAETDADVGFVVSTFVYDNVIRHERERAAPELYQAVRTRVKESELSGWMRLLGPAR